MRRPGPLPAVLVAAALGLGACAGVPTPPEPAADVATSHPAVEPAQAEQVRTEVQQRLQEARVAADTDLVAAAASGPAAELQQLGIRLDGPQDEATAVDPLPADVLVAPRVDGWPRWFAVVTTPGAGGADAPSAAADDEDVVQAQELPVLELYASPRVRSPYRLWARLTMLPGAELPAFASAELGAESLGDGPLARSGGEAAADAGASGASEEPEDPDAAEDSDDLRAALADLAERYASVMTDGDASPFAAQFQPDEFVEATRARAQAERDAVAAVADTTVVHEPFGGGEVLFAARAADGDVLAVTAVTSTTTMTVRGGAGELRPGTEVRAAAGIEQTNGTLTTRSVAALAFLVPAEQGAIRLVAVGEGLVAAEAS